ncbi:MAG: hypothetical protein LBH98_06620 [Chitinispirillales bacterium]|jgi:hypothetical protein|nr:hypothetical protein [Chitinispirillales bacterium]
MIILQISLLLILFLILVVLFVENKFSFDFYSPNIWNIRWETIFFKYSFGSNGNNFDFFLKFKHKEKLRRKTEIEFPKESKDYYESERKTETHSRKSKSKIKIQKPKKQRQKSENYKESNNSDLQFLDEDEEKTEEERNWFDFIKKIWEKEKKPIKALLKFVATVIKLSLKLLTPAKIESNLFGGVRDPAETGWLYSLFILFNSSFENNKRISLKFIPNFVENGWKFDGHIMYSFSIAGIFLFIFIIIFRFPYFAVIKSLFRYRKFIWKKN